MNGRAKTTANLQDIRSVAVEQDQFGSRKKSNDTVVIQGAIRDVGREQQHKRKNSLAALLNHNATLSAKTRKESTSVYSTRGNERVPVRKESQQIGQTSKKYEAGDQSSNSYLTA